MERDFQIDWAAIVQEARKRRKDRGLSQQRLAALAKVTQPTISRFELNREDIQLSSALAILGVLGMTGRKVEGSILLKRNANSPEEGSFTVLFAPYAGAGGALQPYAINSEAGLRQFLTDLHIEPQAQQRAFASLAHTGSSTIPNILLRRTEIAQYWPLQQL